MPYSTISGGGSVDPTVIINRARDLLELPAAARDPQIPDGFAPFPGWSAALIEMPDGAIGALPVYRPPDVAPPAPSDVNPQEAAYRAVEAVLSLPALPLPTAPRWGAATAPAARPEGELSAPPVDWPRADPSELPASAGLSPVALPELAMGERPRPRALAVPAWIAAPLAPFAAPLPEYEEPAAPDPLALAAPSDDARGAAVRATIKRLLSGETPALDGLAQTALLDARTEDLDREERQAEQMLFAVTAARGFSLPCPALADGLLSLAEKGRKEREGRNREVRDETIRRARETLGSATDAALVVERARFALHANYVGNLLKTQRFNVRMAAAVYDAAVRLFNVKAGLLAILLRAWREYAGAVKAQNGALDDQARANEAVAESYRAESDGRDAQWGSVRALAQIERLRVELAALPADEYEAMTVGVGANLAVARQNIEAYGQAIRAWSQAVETDAARWDAWAAQIDAVESVSALDAANAREATGYLQAEAARAQTYAGYTGSALQHLASATEEWRAYAGAQRGYMQALTARVQAEGQATDAYARALGAATGYAETYNRAEAGRAEAANNLGLAQADQVTRQQALDAQAVAAQARIEAGRRGARAQAAAGLAQSFLGVTSASMRLSGSVGLSQRTGDTSSQTFSAEGSRGWRLSRSSSSQSET